MTFLKQGRPPTWQLLVLVNGAFLLLWLYLRITGKTRMNPANLNLLQALFLVLNAAVIWRDTTYALLRPFLRFFS